MCFVSLTVSVLYCSQDVREAGFRFRIGGFVGRGFFILVGHGLSLLEVMVEGVKSDEPEVLSYAAEEFQDRDGGQIGCSA